MTPTAIKVRRQCNDSISAFVYGVLLARLPDERRITAATTMIYSLAMRDACSSIFYVFVVRVIRVYLEFIIVILMLVFLI